jgi:antitoxin HigA-1
MLMHNPPHPGTVVKHSLIEGTGLSVTKAAEILGVERITLSKLINGKSGISPEMAVRLSMALETTSQMWINMQAMYDLIKAEKKRKKLKIKPISVFMHAHAIA